MEARATDLARFVAEAVAGEVEDLARRWRQQSRAVAPRVAGREGDDDAGAELLVRAVVGVLSGSLPWPEEALERGWTMGATAHRAQVPLHYVLKELELLRAMTLYACERAANAFTGTAGPGEGIRLARRLEVAFSQISLAAVHGFTSGHVGELRLRYRSIRHDLRNPLGTIKSAVAMMEDPTISEELRNGRRLPEIVARNIKALDVLIGDLLSDGRALDDAFARQAVSLRDVALAVRRELRAAAHEAECEIAVSDALPTATIDPAVLELMLKAVLGAALAHAPEGSRIAIEPGEMQERSVAIAVACDGFGPKAERDADVASARELLGDAELTLIEEIAARTGGTVSFGERIVIDVPRSGP